MIRPEQLAEALERLDPRERELLALSLRRRVPDEALARVYDVPAHEVARRRAGAIEHLANELGAQRGEDLGAVLKALLDESAWTAAEPAHAPPATAAGAPVAADPGAPAAAEHPAPAADPGAPAAAEHPAPAAVGDPPAGNGVPVRAPASSPAATPSRTAPPPPVRPVRRPPPTASTPVVPVASEPVLEMLAAREGVRGPSSSAAAKRPKRRGRTVVAALLGSFVAAVIGGAAAVVGLSEWDDDSGTNTASLDDGTRNFIPQLGGPIEAPFPSEPQPIACYSTAYVPGPSTLYREPGGRVRIKVSGKTEWGSDRVFGVVRRRGDWVAVQAPELENGELAWLPTNRARLDCVRWSLHADLSRRKLYVRRDGETVREFVIAIGRRQNPTPKGRFSVTDKLRVTDKGSPYGCCVLAVSGHQERLPPSWPGGDRLAVHATRELSSLGRPASLGCLRVTSSQARWLINTIPLGAPLFVRA